MNMLPSCLNSLKVNEFTEVQATTVYIQQYGVLLCLKLSIDAEMTIKSSDFKVMKNKTE